MLCLGFLLSQLQLLETLFPVLSGMLGLSLTPHVLEDSVLEPLQPPQDFRRGPAPAGWIVQDDAAKHLDLGALQLALFQCLPELLCPS